MRRADREIRTREGLEAVLQEAQVCRLALHSPDGFPYLVPLNYGWRWTEEQPVLYFHCASDGRKLDLLRQDNRVGFALDCRHALVGEETACSYTMHYASIIGRGLCEIVTDEEERLEGLQCLMEHLTGHRFDSFEPRWFKPVTVLRLRVLEMTGKQHTK